MSHTYLGGCEHVHVEAVADPIDNHVCHCNVCKSVTGQQATHVAFFRHADVRVDHPERLKRQPFNKDNPDGPLELCTCAECGAPIMLDDRQKRIRAEVPNLMGFDVAGFPQATYHAFWDETKGYPRPDDGRPVHSGLRPDFTWPSGA
ncbi:GFA family protein [Albidovulum sp.]